MGWIMNRAVKRSLKDCEKEIVAIRKMIQRQGVFHPSVPFLTKYSLIKACGTIEVAFKSIIADFFGRSRLQQVRHYIEEKVTNSSMNPSLGNIERVLKSFDANWESNFRLSLNANRHQGRIRSSLKSLVNARNEFAHGLNPTLSISDIESYYKDSVIIINVVASVVR